MIHIPKTCKGRRSPEQQAQYERDLSIFADDILEINSRLDFQVSSRGYENIESIDTDIETYIKNLHKRISATIEGYTPISFWDDKDYYIQMWVEKIDLKSLFNPVCEKYHIPIANAKGWSDLHMRCQLMERFKEHEEAGRQCVLLYCGDHDPTGLVIPEFIKDNLAEMSNQVSWKPDNLIIDRFGLNIEFIEQYNLSWIDGLITGSGKDLGDPKHRDHNKPFVQNYIKQFSKRKVEANALVINPDAGRLLCENAILKYLSDDMAPEKYENMLMPLRMKLKNQFKSTNLM